MVEPLFVFEKDKHFFLMNQPDSISGNKDEDDVDGFEHRQDA